MAKLTTTAMAFSRDVWIGKFRQRFEGTLKEYTKIYVTEKLGLKNYWDKEVEKLASKLVQMFEQVKTKGRWNKYTAAAEAFIEASGEQVKCKEAINEFRNYSEYKKSEIKKIQKYWQDHVPDSMDLSLEIIEKYFPAKHLKPLMAAIEKELA